MRAAAGLLLLVASLPCQDRPVALVGARILPVASPPIEEGVLVFQHGRILDVGPAATTEVPAGAERREAAGKVVLPGLVDTHSHIGGGSGGDASAALHPDVDILDSLDVHSPGFRRARAGGITSVNVMPGSGHLMSGRTVYLKLRPARTIEDMLVRDAEGRPMGGLKMANGTNPRRAPPFPGTRARAAAQVREFFHKAMDHREKLRRAEQDPAKAPPRDLGMETLVEVLEGRRIVHHHTHRHDDVLTALRIGREFGLRMVLHHVSEGWKVADEIAEAGVPCSIIVLDSPGGKLEAVDLVPHTGAVLERAGVAVAYHSDDWITDSRLFLRSGALGVRYGMTPEGALKALTLAGAAMMDMEERVGSLEPGKDADFVVLSGEPFSVYTRVLETWVEGEQVFDFSRPEDRLFAVGGVGAGERSRSGRGCCGEEDA